MAFGVSIRLPIKHGFVRGRAFGYFPDRGNGSSFLDSYEYSQLLQSCRDIESLKAVHAQVVTAGYQSNMYLAAKLIEIYRDFSGSMEDGRKVFNNTTERDSQLYNVLIRGYTTHGSYMEAIRAYDEMQMQGLKPNHFSFPFVLKACSAMGDLEKGKEIHRDSMMAGMNGHTYVCNGLIAMYARCGDLTNARQVFDEMPERDVISWNSMIAGYSQNDHPKEALELFHGMLLGFREGLDGVTLVAILPSLSQLSALGHGRWAHCYAIKNGFVVDVVLGTALVNMYAKCGRLSVARLVFDRMAQRNVFSWNALIGGYGVYGLASDALGTFSLMLKANISPDAITFVYVLSACAHAGLVDDARQWFRAMRVDHSLEPSGEHYACMVDALGRAGLFDEAMSIINSMPFEPGADVWGSLLGACRIHKDLSLAEIAAERVLMLDPLNAGRYVLVANIYAASGMWDEVARVRTLMKERGVRKPLGSSSIEVRHRVHTFGARDESHPFSNKIYEKLTWLEGELRGMGYEPDVNSVLHDVGEEEKGEMVARHSERLAIAFGLIYASPGSTIRVTKNLRVCVDCHSVTKMISKLVGREIVVRDSNRFHHFKGGACSCGDYW
ncbi:hypothetical protein AMTRI_Chr09g14970 [Amborella trichopoda]